MMKPSEKDHEIDSEHLGAEDRIPYWYMIFDQGYCTPMVKSHCYPGKGTSEDPYVVSWIEEGDNRNPNNWSVGRRAAITCCISASTFACALSSSAYTGSYIQVQRHFGISNEVLCSQLPRLNRSNVP